MPLPRPIPLMFSLSCLCASGSLLAQGETGLLSGTGAFEPQRFGPYEDNYVLYNRMDNRRWAGRDEAALRAHYSFKFTFCGPRFVRNPDPKASTAAKSDNTGEDSLLCPNRKNSPKLSQIELFAAYTGEFDFYMGTRDSGPVINRTSNPGLFARVPLRLLLDGSQYAQDQLEIGIEHRSDGQVTEVTAPADVQRANLAYERDDRYFFDTVSRGSNYLSLAANGYDMLNTGLDLRAKLRVYLNQDTAVTWGPLAGRGRSIADYDRVQLQAGYTLGKSRFEAEWRLGNKALATDSVTLGWQYLEASLPIYVRVHLGTMNTLSNYTQRQDSIGIGLRFN